MTVPCDICELPFTHAEWDDRHWPHEPGCARETCRAGSCQCVLVAHAACCPSCIEEGAA